MMETQADRCFNHYGDPGHYVVNPQTSIAVAGPFFVYDMAKVEMDRRNRAYPNDSNLLVVVTLPGDHA